MPATVITCNAIIRACEKGQQWTAAAALLREMRQSPMQAHVITYDAIISACEQGCPVKAAVASLREM